MLYTVILAGGRGERFWPLSRGHRPKQLLALNSDKSLLLETIDRVKDLVPFERTYVVAGDALEKPILAAIPELTRGHVLTEPLGRNTCMAIGLAAAELGALDPEAVMLVLSADHRIEPAGRLREILSFGAELAAAEERLVTIGITPTRAETGYGYIETGDVVSRKADLVASHVAGFKEKPEPRQAQVYYYGKKHLWNAGIFVWSVKSIWRALELHCPEHFKALSACRANPGSRSCKEAAYESVPDISIDFAVLEKAENVVTIKGDLVWDDVGSWLALDRLRAKNQEGNVIVGDAVTLDTAETIVFNEAPGIIATLGVSDLVVVRSGQITFVAHKSRLAQIRKMVSHVAQEYPDEV